jgi:hypothetical protein
LATLFPEVFKERICKRSVIEKVRSMLEIEIEDGLLDCPKYGMIGELRCCPSCNSFESKDENHIDCHFDDETEDE